MKGLAKRLVVLLTVMTMLVSSTLMVSANTDTTGASGEAYGVMIDYIREPWARTELASVSGNISAGELGSYNTKSYKAKDGGYYLYSEITRVQPSVNNPNAIVDDNKFNQLTLGAKQKYLEDLFRIANAVAYASEKGGDTMQHKLQGANSDTVNQLYRELENREGMGSVLMASIMENTKPDFTSANKIYKPFSGLVGTILGLIAVLIMALLGITMALDIAYIVIPAVQLMLDGSEGGGSSMGGPGGQPGGSGGRGKGMSGLVSQAARNAVQAANGGQGGQGQGGEGNKMAIGVYFKYRWLELVVLGICLLYLVSGNIYSFVAWVLDLVSGFLGF